LDGDTHIAAVEMNPSPRLHLGYLKATQFLQEQALDGRGAKALLCAVGCSPALFQLSLEKFLL